MEIAIYITIYFAIASAHFAFAYTVYQKYSIYQKEVLPCAVLVSLFFPVCVWFVVPWWIIRGHFSEKISKELRPTNRPITTCPESLLTSIAEANADRCPLCREILAKSRKREQSRPEYLSYSNYD